MESKLTNIAMEIITYSGVAKSHAIEAIRKARKSSSIKEIDDTTLPILEEARKNQVRAAQAHMSVLQMEAKKEINGPTVLFMHAEDQMLSTETIIALAKEIIALNKLLLEKTN